MPTMTAVWDHSTGPRHGTTAREVAAIWAGWHIPLFAVVTTFREFTATVTIGWVFGLTCGAIVLGWLYNRTGSVLAVAVWHATYNVTSATAATHGTVAAVSTTTVIVAAICLFVGDVITHGRILAPPAAPPPANAPPPAARVIRPGIRRVHR